MKRNIRLKEMTPLSERSLSPTPEYRTRSNSTLQDGPFEARVDRDGFLITGNPQNETFEPIPCFGGSFVESSYSHEEDRFIAISERELIARGNSIRLLNGGYSGSSSLHIFNTLISKAFPLVGKDGRIVIFVGQTDTAALLEYGTYWSEHPRITPLVPGRRPNAEGMPDKIESVSSVLSSMIDTCRNFHIDAAWAISPYLQSDFSTDTYLRRIYKRNRDAYERVLSVRELVIDASKKTLDSYNQPYFDGQQALDNGNPEFFYDELHLNKHGQHKMAAAFTAWLVNRWALR